MTKIRNFAEITPNLPFTEYNFYEEFRGSFEKTELGRMKKILPLREMAESLKLVNKSMMPKRARKSYFTPEGKVALNGNVFYQMFCDIVIDPAHPLTNYKLLDDIALELAGKLKIQELQNRLAEAWKPYMKDLDTMFTDATCYESDMCYPVDQKLLWECIEKAYALMCEESQRLGLHRHGRLLRDAEGTLRDAEDQGETEDDGDPVHLFRDPHGQRGRVVKSNSRTATGHALKVNRKYAHKRGLRKDRSWNITQ